MQNILVPLGFFAMVTAIVLVSARYRSRERMELIRNGIVPFPAVPGKGSLLWGLVLTLVGLGYALAILALGIHASALMGAAVAIPMGIALLLYHRSTKPDREKAEQVFQGMRMHQDASAAFRREPQPVDTAGQPSA